MSQDSKFPIVCGGTFLTLILMAKTPVATSHQRMKRVSHKNSDDDIFQTLIQVAFPEFEVENTNSYHSTLNNYKKCKREVANAWPLAKEEFIKEIRDLSDDFCYVKRMNSFLKSNILESQMVGLINRVVDLILKDDIANKQKWTVSEGCVVASNSICTCEKVYADYFLWDVWKYIITSANKNKTDVSLYEEWLSNILSQDVSDFIIKEGVIQLSEFEERVTTNVEIAESEEEDDVEIKEKKEEPVKTSHDIMAEQLLKSAQAMADVFGACMDNLVRTEFQKDKTSEQPDDTDILYESSLMQGKLWQRLKNGTITPKLYNSEILLNEYAESEYYEFNEKCFLKTVFIEGEKTIEVIIHANGFDIVGYTSGRNWTSDSSRNRAVGKGTHNFKGIFKVEGIDENSISVQYLYLGEGV